MTSDHEETRKSVGALIPTLSPDDIVPHTFQPEWYAHQAGLFSFGEGEPYRGPLEEEAVADFLFTGTNVTCQKFRKKSPKPLSRLAGEMEREVNLWRFGPGHIKKVSAKVRTQIHSPFEGFSLQETSRLVLESGAEIVHKKPKSYGSSGTLLRRKKVGISVVEESPVEAACREIEQEHAHHVMPDQLFPLTGMMQDVTSEKSTMYRYPGFRMTSINVIWQYRIDVLSMTDWQTHRHEWWNGHLVYEDEGVLIRNQWLLPQKT